MSSEPCQAKRVVEIMSAHVLVCVFVGARVRLCAFARVFVFTCVYVARPAALPHLHLRSSIIISTTLFCLVHRTRASPFDQKAIIGTAILKNCRSVVGSDGSSSLEVHVYACLRYIRLHRTHKYNHKSTTLQISLAQDLHNGAHASSADTARQ